MLLRGSRVWRMSAPCWGGGSAGARDRVVLRDRDNTVSGRTTDSWVAASDGVRRESLRSSAYGMPTLLPLADLDRSGVIDSGDDASFEALICLGDPSTDVTREVVGCGSYGIAEEYWDGVVGSGKGRETRLCNGHG